MEINKELLQKLLPAKTVDEVIKLARENGFELLSPESPDVCPELLF